MDFAPHHHHHNHRSVPPMDMEPSGFGSWPPPPDHYGGSPYGFGDDYGPSSPPPPYGPPPYFGLGQAAGGGALSALGLIAIGALLTLMFTSRTGREILR